MTSVTNEFISMKNKGMLWELMSNESPDFKKNVRSNFNEIQKKFENCINRTAELNSSKNLLIASRTHGICDSFICGINIFS